MSAARMPVVFLPDGGGPWPFVELDMFEPEEVAALAHYLRSLPGRIGAEPVALLVISAFHYGFQRSRSSHRTAKKTEAEMTFLHTVPVEKSTGPVRAMYQRFQKPLGHVPNYAKAFSLRPALMDAWANLLKSLRESMSFRSYELATLAAARALRSSYCSLAHGSVLAEKVLDAESVLEITQGKGPIEPGERALMAFAAKVAESASDVTRDDVEELRSHGFRDEEIFDIAAAAAARCFFSKLLDALGAEPDATYLEMGPSLRAALTVGRPISSEPVERLDDDA